MRDQNRAPIARYGVCCGCLLAPLVLGFLVFYPVYQRTYFPFAHSMPLDQIERHVRFPPGTRLVHSVCQQAPGETTILAVLEMEAAQAVPFVRSLGHRPVVVSRTSRLGVEAAEGVVTRSWWTPGRPRRFTAARSQGLGLVVGLDDPDRAVVYLGLGYGFVRPWEPWKPAAASSNTR